MTDIGHDCTTELHDVSLRATPARLGILHVLEHSIAPVDVETVRMYLRKQNLEADDATIFRILSKFAQTGIARLVQFNEGKKRYEYAKKPSHHHFVCDSCGSVIDINGCILGPLEKSIEKTKGVSVSRHSLEFFGLCRRCRS